MSGDSECILVLTTCPDRAAAERLARVLVEGALAACVNVLPGVRSIYRWRGALESADEHLLLIKTAAARYDKLENAIRANHPYELPEVIAVPITAGSNDYLQWINSLVSQG